LLPEDGGEAEELLVATRPVDPGVAAVPLAGSPGLVQTVGSVVAVAIVLFRIEGQVVTLSLFAGLFARLAGVVAGPAERQTGRQGPQNQEYPDFVRSRNHGASGARKSENRGPRAGRRLGEPDTLAWKKLTFRGLSRWMWCQPRRPTIFVSSSLPRSSLPMYSKPRLW
jgi:hypothetical protein